MRYIRTKDGIIRIVVEPSEFDEEERRKIPDNCTMVKSNNLFGCAIVRNESIVKQADTIKELCDEFVFHTTDGYEQHFLSRGHSEEVLRNKNIDLKEYLSCRTIYGAIWTDKGLIYVAKMNEKGELELL